MFAASWFDVEHQIIVELFTERERERDVHRRTHISEINILKENIQVRLFFSTVMTNNNNNNNQKKLINYAQECQDQDWTLQFNGNKVKKKRISRKRKSTSFVFDRCSSQLDQISRNWNI